MRILLLDDHSFYADEIYEGLTEMGYNVEYAHNYKEADALMKLNNTYDCCLLDIILQNGKTGIGFAELYESRIGRVMFITGCDDRITVDAIANNSKYASASKNYNIWKPLKSFLNGECPRILSTSSSEEIPAFN